MDQSRASSSGFDHEERVVVAVQVLEHAQQGNMVGVLDVLAVLGVGVVGQGL
jgi:hypothetical protein